MRSSLLFFLVMLAGCPPKPTGPTGPEPTTVTPPSSTPVSPPPTTPAETSPTVPTTSPDGTAVAPETPAEPVVSESVAVARKVNDAASLLTNREAGRAERALEALKEIAAQHPELPAVHYNMGVAYHQMGQDNEARRAWTRATEVDPTFAKAWKNLGALSAAGGRQDLALASYQTGTRYSPQDIELRVAAISALRELKRYDDAVAEAKAALMINSKALPIYNELALVYIETGKFDLAKFTLQKAVQDIPGADGNPDVHAILGEIYYRLGFAGDALKSFQRSLELNPYQLSAMLYLAGYYLDNRAWTDAAPLLERAASLAPNDAGIQLNLGIAYRGQGRFEDAAAAYKKALQLRPSDPEPYRNLAVLYGDHQKAYDAALEAIESYRRAGGGPPAELDAWVKSINKEKEKVERQRKRDEERRKKEEEERKADGGLFGNPDGGATPAPDGSTPPPSPDGTTPPPAPQPEPTPAPTPPPEPTPQPAPGDSPW